MSDPAETCRPPANRCRRAARSLVVSVGIALVIALTVRATVAEAFVAATNGVSPEIPKGARVLAYKLDSAYSPGDIVVFRESERFVLSRVTGVNDAGGRLTVRKNDQPESLVSVDDVVGRVVLSTR